MIIKNILITGKPKSGKTTLIKRLIREKLSWAGFYTEEIIQGKDRVGFKIITSEEKTAILAAKNIQSKYKIGKYKVDLKSLEEVAVGSIKKALRKQAIIIIDEIGKMELFSEEFKRAVIKALESNRILLATLSQAKHIFIEDIKRRKDVEIFYLHRKNQDQIFSIIKEKLLRSS